MKRWKFDHFLVVLLCVGIACVSVQIGYKAEAETKTSCPNCGMILKEWAHTNHEFTNSEGQFRTCSIHCVADMSKKSGEEPKNVQVALHLQPEKMIPVEKAVYVMGSKDPGTMTKVSKLAFESQEAAGKFVAEKGGKTATFSEALAAATEELPQAKPMIQTNRKSKGKIIDPAEQDRCVVCNMLSAKYPRHNAQLVTVDNKRFHFCSTQCLFEFVKNPEKYGSGKSQLGAVWVHDYLSGMYLFGRNAYYVVGSKVLGPMGHEAIPFDLKSDAVDFAKANGGQALKFNEVTIDKIKAK